ncbi:MAG: TlpA disulfide reductase family protein [Burkholderiaceae bacterium]
MAHRFFSIASGALCALISTGLWMHSGALAQTSPGAAVAVAKVADAPAPNIAGLTLDKKPFLLASTRGKVVLVMFWSTDCAVCRDKMRELRENARGWANQPFELVLVNVDKSMQDVESYNAIINKAVPLKQRFTQMWTGDPSYIDNLNTALLPRGQLPATLLIGKNGKLVERYNGRIPAEVWDTIADLL